MVVRDPHRWLPSAHHGGLLGRFALRGDEFGSIIALSGKKWGKVAAVDKAAGIASISRRAKMACIAVDYAGRSLMRNSHGTWSHPATVQNAGAFAAASCGSKTRCFAADEGGAVLRRAP